MQFRRCRGNKDGRRPAAACGGAGKAITLLFVSPLPPDGTWMCSGCTDGNAPRKGSGQHALWTCSGAAAAPYCIDNTMPPLHALRAGGARRGGGGGARGAGGQAGGAAAAGGQHGVRGGMSEGEGRAEERALVSPLLRVSGGTAFPVGAPPLPPAPARLFVSLLRRWALHGSTQGRGAWRLKRGCAFVCSLLGSLSASYLCCAFLQKTRCCFSELDAAK